MNACEVALAVLRRLQSTRAADRQRLAADAARFEDTEEIVEPNAMTADRDEIRGAQTLRQQAHLDGITGFEILALSRDRDESIGATKRRDRTGPLAERKRTHLGI